MPPEEVDTWGGSLIFIKLGVPCTIGVGAGPAGPVLAGPLFGDFIIGAQKLSKSSKRRSHTYRNVLREFQLYVPTAQLDTRLR